MRDYIGIIDSIIEETYYAQKETWCLKVKTVDRDGPKKIETFWVGPRNRYAIKRNLSFTTVSLKLFAYFNYSFGKFYIRYTYLDTDFSIDESKLLPTTEEVLNELKD
ncbi:MAG: hypothetical protein ACRCZ9_10120 [Fusobacteriaceae bacterium]